MLLLVTSHPPFFCTTFGKYIPSASCLDSLWVLVANIGAWQALSRAILSELIPKGREAEFFSLYEITDKGSAWVGPLLTALIRDITGNFRHSFWALIIMILISMPILWRVNVEQGTRDAATVTLSPHEHTSDDDHEPLIESQ